MFALNSRIEASGPHINDMLNYIYIYKIHIIMLNLEIEAPELHIFFRLNLEIWALELYIFTLTWKWGH